MDYGPIFITVLIAFYVLLVIANWRIFTKANEAGWKSLIPIYNSYILYKISWSPLYFLLIIILSIIVTVMTFVSGALPVIIIGFILYAVIAVIQILAIYKLAKAYGHGIGFTIGLIVLNPVFMLILGFGKSKYIKK